MRYDEIIDHDSKNIEKLVPNDFLYSLALTNKFESWSYPKSFMSLVHIKDYIYMINDNEKVVYKSSYILHIS